MAVLVEPEDGDTVNHRDIHPVDLVYRLTAPVAGASVTRLQRCAGVFRRSRWRTIVNDATPPYRSNVAQAV